MMVEYSEKEAAEEQDSAAELEGGSYEVICDCFVEQVKEFGQCIEVFNM